MNNEPKEPIRRTSEAMAIWSSVLPSHRMSLYPALTGVCGNESFEVRTC